MKTKTVVFAVAGTLACFAMVATTRGELRMTSAADQPSHMLVYIGSYAERDAEGIHIFRLDMATGGLSRIGAATGVKNPSFQAIHPNQKFLYTVGESSDFQGGRSGSVAAFAIDPDTGALTFLNEEPTLGTGPCHVIVDRGGRHALAANYSSGSVVVLPINPDGSVGTACAFNQHEGSSVHPRQTSPHAHCVNNDAADRFVVSADLGLDQILIYRYDSQRGNLLLNPDMPAVKVEPGAGPRHFSFHPNGKFAYVINELNSTVTAFSYDADRGTLTTLQNVSTLPPDFTGDNTTAEVFVSPDGQFLYGSNRGHNSIVVFAIDPQTGQLRFVSHHPTQGEQPRNFGIDPTGTFLLAANQRTGNVVVFRVDKATGRLESTGHVVQLPTPVCVTFLVREE